MRQRKGIMPWDAATKATASSSMYIVQKRSRKAGAVSLDRYCQGRAGKVLQSGLLIEQEPTKRAIASLVQVCHLEVRLELLTQN
jgi:hypothetical protein